MYLPTSCRPRADYFYSFAAARVHGEKFRENGAPGGITRRCAPRPSGRPKGRSPPLRGVVEPIVHVVGSTLWQIDRAIAVG
jgi:hypothetical protein